MGKIYDGKNNTKNFVVTRINDLQILINHLIKYPLHTQKQADFLLFKARSDIILNKIHFTIEGLQQIVNLKASLNKGLSEQLKINFPNYIPSSKPIISTPLTLNPYWIIGFINGDGSFDIRIVENYNNSGRYKVQLRLRITQHIRDINLLQCIINRLGCGTLNKYTNQDAVRLNITSFKDISNKIIPFFENGILLGGKIKDYTY